MLSTTKMAAASSFTNLQSSYSALPSVLILGFGEHTHSFLTINAHLLPKISDECVFWMPKTWKIYLPEAQNTRAFPRMRSSIRTSFSETTEAVDRPMRGASWAVEQTMCEGNSPATKVSHAALIFFFFFIMLAWTNFAQMVGLVALLVMRLNIYSETAISSPGDPAYLI